MSVQLPICSVVNAAPTTPQNAGSFEKNVTGANVAVAEIGIGVGLNSCVVGGVKLMVWVSLPTVSVKL